MEKGKNRPRMHCPPPPPPTPYPWLVYCHGKRLKSQTFYSISDPQNIHVRSIPELRNKKVWTSGHGWLVMSREAETDFHLWNPSTLESIRLPPLDLKPKQYVTDCLLTSPPDDLDSTFLLFVCNPRSIIFCCIRDKKWITRVYDEEIKVISYDSNDYICGGVICNKQIYATTFTKCRMVLIDIIKPSRLVIRPLSCWLSFVQSSLAWRNDTYLFESCGDLFTIQIDFGGVHDKHIVAISVRKLDFSSMNWNEVESCPGRAFFLSMHSVISCPAIESDKTESRIYFTQDDDNKLYSYSIEDKSITVSLPCPQIPTPWQTPIWIMADSRLHDAPVEIKNYSNEEEREGSKEEDGVLRGRILEPSTKENKEAANQNLLDIPKDIVEKISTHLPLLDYMNFRRLSRKCRSVAPPKQWRTASVKLESQIETPWLMFPGKVKGIRSLVEPRFGGKYYVRIPQILENAVVCYSKHGWLLMVKDRSFMLFNPLAKSIIDLPDITSDAESYSFSSSPDSSDCIVVGIAFDVQVVFITRPGMTNWTIVPFDDEISFRLCPLSCPVLLESALYFLGEDGNLATLALDENIEERPSIEAINVKKPCSSFHENYLVECGGELLSVTVGKQGEWVQVFKFNPSALAWEKLESLGNNSLYLCGLSCFATQAKTPGMENKIYFPRFRGESIIFYSLATGKFHISESGNSLPNYLGTREQLYCSWIEPRW